MAGAAGLDLRIARVLQENSHPADLKIGARGYDQVRSPRTRHETRLRIYAVHILKRARRGVDINLVTTQFSDERGPVGSGGEYFEGGVCRQRRAQHCAGKREQMAD